MKAYVFMYLNHHEGIKKERRLESEEQIPLFWETILDVDVSSLSHLFRIL